MQVIKKNGEWYQIAEELLMYPIGNATYIPVIYNFYIQKNIMKILELKDELDNCRRQIIEHYGERKNDGVVVAEPYINEANKELKVLSNIETELEFYAIPLEAFKDIKLTTGELKSLMPMIIEDPEFAQHLLEDPKTYVRTVCGTPRVKGDK